MLAPQWQTLCILSKAEDTAHCYNKTKLQWLDGFMAACTGQISMCKWDSGCADIVSACMELNRLCVCIRITVSQEACTGGWLSLCAPIMDDEATGRLGAGWEQEEELCALWQRVRVI